MFEGRFSKLRTIGAGAMGKVYKAWDDRAERHVALKVLEAKDTSNRFEREARVLSQLIHPNIVRYMGHGVTPDGQPWLSMEWLDGEDLESRLRKGSLSFGDTLRIARAVAGGLAWAHEQGFVHRDLKPSNVFIVGGDFGNVKIVDFGLARGDILDAPITKTGTFMGTIEYMPPEQIHDAKRADARADVYSLGAVLYHCMTGQPPHQGATVVHTMRKALSEEALPMRTLRPDAPPGFEALVASMLQKNREDRPPDGRAVFASLTALESGTHPPFDPTLDVEGPTIASPSGMPISSPRPSIPRPPPSEPSPFLSPKSGTLIMQKQPMPSAPPASQPSASLAKAAAPAQGSGWLGTLLGLAVLLALAFAAWRRLHP
jgi:serine/threonine protein kinase